VPAGFGFGLATGIRSWLYRRLLKQKRAPVSVISIGNITVGGTGKTPFVIMLSQRLRSLGKSVAVVTRGYGRRRKDPVLIVSRGTGAELSALDAGDEAVLTSENTQGIPVICAFDRSEGCRRAVSEFGSDCIVLDDGFQHLSLARDLDVVLLDAERPYGNGRFLPAGHLRERPSALKRADVVVRVSRWPGGEPVPQDTVREPGGVPVISAVLRPGSLELLEEKKTAGIETISGKRVHAVSGIAKPESFERMLRELGAEIVSTSRFPDHHEFSDKDIAKIAGESKDNRVDLTITTEKDACKLRDLIGGIGLSALTLEVDLGEDLDKLVDMVMDRIEERRADEPN
jgi:tetraacyldisaccharide 4'-kinase